MPRSSSTSDHEMSDGSNSPASSSSRESPYASPSQQVPQLTINLNSLSCADKNLFNQLRNDGPFLRIIEQPQSHFRFRYVSEMVGTHGCLLAKSSDNKNKKHPTVELVNYAGRAIIRCRLAQYNNDNVHPHKLLENEQDKDVCCTVPEKGSYKVGFPGMGIIHTAKKEVVNLLLSKLSEQKKGSKFNEKELRSECERRAKEIELNIVRLMFTAHDPVSGRQICPPVFSDNINNMKSAATNDLKICRLSLHKGRPQGGDDVFIFVEKVNKKNIMIRFFELDDSNKVRWSENAKFILSDVHHQYGIAFRTPPYENPKTPVDVQVYMELFRPSDRRTSEPVPFTYKADDVEKEILRAQKSKKRKMNPYPSTSSSDCSLTDELPITVLNTEADLDALNVPMHRVEIPLSSGSPVQCGLSSALNTGIPLPVQSHPGVTSLLDLKLDSGEMRRIVDTEQNPPVYISQEFWNQYTESFPSLNDLPMEMDSMSFIKYSTSSNLALLPDSGRVKIEPKSPPKTEETSQPGEVYNEYPGVYKKEDASEVKQLVRDLCDIIQTKKMIQNEDVKQKLERLFEIRLSNGDTFLHMTLCSDQSSLEAIVRLIHAAKMSHLLNCTNNRQQTILHLAVIHGSPEIVALLIAKGCDPMQKDYQDENAIHYAIRYNNKLLGPLLDAVKTYKVRVDLDDTNNEKQTALHLCVQYNAVGSAARLLAAGATLASRDERARTPVHLAAYDARVELLRVMLDYVPSSEIDAPDGYGHTALQIVCGGPHTTLDMVKLLLEKKADPLKQEDNNESAFKLSRDKPAVRALIAQYVHSALPDDVKSEPEDDCESADEEVELSGLCELGLYARAVATKIDAANAWRLLAERLNVSEMMSWLENQPSPAYKLLYHIKDCREEVTSKSLALILEDMGLSDAASIIRSCLE